MQRAKLFLENFMIYGLMTVLNKFMPLLMLPVITRLLADPSDFGVYDMYNTIYDFGLPLAMLGLYDAMFREHFETDDPQYQFNVTTTALRLITFSSVLVSGILAFFSGNFSNLFFGSSNYGHVVMLSALAIFLGNNVSIIAAPTRIQNKRKVYVYSSLFNSMAYYLLAVLLIYLGFSYLGMIYASILASFLLLVFFWFQNKSFFTQGQFSMKIAKELLKIGLPLLPTFIIYWIYDSLDKLMIANFLGTHQLGIFSIGSRLASVSLLIYSAFSGGWQYFSFSTMKDEDQVVMNSKIFEYLGAISFLSLIVIYPFLKWVFELLFPPEYANGLLVVPYLYLTPLLLMLFQVVANQFIIVKKSYWSTITLSAGAIANIFLNWLLIPIFGIEGAAAASLIGYVISVTVVCLVASKLDLHVMSKRFLLITALMGLYLVAGRTYLQDNFSGQLMLSLLLTVIYLHSYREEIELVFTQLNQRFMQRKQQLK